MNILHIVLSLHTGGLERVVLDLIKAGCPGVNSVVVCLNDIGDHEKALRREKIPFYSLGSYGKHKISTIRKIISIVRSHNIDVIHTHNPGPHFYGCCAGKISKTPVIHTKHGRNYPDNKKEVLKNFLLSLLSFKIVCVSKDAANVAIDIEHSSKSKVVTILNGIDIAKYQGEKKRTRLQNDTAEKEIRIGIVARLSSEKDHATLLKAFQIVLLRTPRVSLTIIGDGPLRQDLEQLVQQLGIREDCFFLGNRDDVPKLLQFIDVFVLSSTTEGVSLTLLEAMAASLPVVCTDVGGNSEVVENGVTGIIVPPMAPKLLAEALLDVVGDRELRAQMGMAGCRRVNEKFNLESTVVEYDKLYKIAVQR